MGKGYSLIVFILLIILLNGCQSKQNNEDKSLSNNTQHSEQNMDLIKNAKTTTFPASYQKSGNHTNIDIQSVNPQKAYFIEGCARPLELDFETIGRTLIPESEIGEADIEAKQILSKKMVDDTFYEKMFGWGKDSFSYYTYHGSELFSSIVDERKADDYNLPLYEQEKTFSFGSAEEALEDIKARLNAFGITIDDTYLVHTYYLSHETLKQQESHYDMEGNREEGEYKTDWSEEDDAYMFYISQTYCDLPDYHIVEGMSVRAEDSSAQITVMYGKEGILYMKVQNIGIYEMGTKQIELLPFETVAESVLRYFDDILDNAAYEVTDARLICDYAPSHKAGDEKTLCPVWAFHVIETNDGDIPVNYELRINASTGTVLQ